MRLFELKLSGSSLPINFKKFMDAIYSATYANPINPKERVWEDKVALHLIPRSDEVTLQSFRTLERGKGYAHEALNWLGKLADQYNVPMSLEVFPLTTFQSKKIPKKALKNLYAKHGFTSKAHDLMVRQPNKLIGK